MTGKERMQRILRHEPVDRIGLYEHFWNDTYQAWQQQGHIAPGESYEDHFGFDMQEHWSFNLTADLDFERQVVAETADTHHLPGWQRRHAAAAQVSRYHARARRFPNQNPGGLGTHQAVADA